MQGSIGTSLLRRLIVRGVLGLALIDAILFGLARRVDWGAAWVLTVLFAIYLAAGVVWFLPRDPDLLSERLNSGSRAPAWDRVFVRTHWVFLLVLFATAALDAGRVRWSHVPVGVQVLAVVGMLTSFAMIWWCTAANHFLSSQVRIQTERGHRVVRDGPYRLVRHPMYMSLMALMPSMALLLGSWLAMLPACVIGVLLVVRTLLEDRMLKEQLPGYREYAQQVTRRLIPGIW